jgi:hypothetical protein
MSSPHDWNALDRAIHALCKSKAALPEVFRALTEGELCALMPYHPEVEGANIQIQNGSPFQFVRLKEGDGFVVPIFSSDERADEGLKSAGVPENTYCVAAMNARDMLEVLGKMKMWAHVNRGCTTGWFTLPPNLMRDLVDGSALKPTGPEVEGTVEQTVLPIDPADYPTDLIQPLFETLRRDRKFRAAWVLRRPEPTAAGGTHYQVLLLMDPRDEMLEHDFSIVLQAARKKPDEVDFGFLDETDHAYIDAFLKHAAPFYTARDFKRPAT